MWVGWGSYSVLKYSYTFVFLLITKRIGAPCILYHSSRDKCCTYPPPEGQGSCAGDPATEHSGQGHLWDGSLKLQEIQWVHISSLVGKAMSTLTAVPIFFQMHPKSKKPVQSSWPHSSRNQHVITNRGLICILGTRFPVNLFTSNGRIM